MNTARSVRRDQIACLYLIRRRRGGIGFAAFEEEEVDLGSRGTRVRTHSGGMPESIQIDRRTG